MGSLMRSRVKLPMVAFVLAVLAAGCGVLGDQDARDPEASALVPTPSTPPPPAAPTEPVDPPAELLEADLAGVRIVAGWDPYPVFDGGFSPWTDGAAMEVVDWLQHLLPARPAPLGAARIDVEVAQEREPAPCFAFHRPVTGVRVDVPGPAAESIAALLLVEAERASALIDDYRSPSEADRAWCEERFEGARVGFLVIEIHGEECTYPDEPDVVCATVGAFGYALGARDFWSCDTFVFDAATGELLDRARLLAPYDPVLLDGLFTRIRAEVPIDVPHLVEQGVLATDLELLPLSADADIIPTLEGLRWRWSPYRHVTGSIDVVVPWDVLESVEREAGV